MNTEIAMARGFCINVGNLPGTGTKPKGHSKWYNEPRGKTEQFFHCHQGQVHMGPKKSRSGNFKIHSTHTLINSKVWLKQL